MADVRLLGLLALSAVGVFGASKADRLLHYTPVEAKVVSIDDACYLEEITGRIVKGEVHRTDPMTCARAEEMKQDPDYKQFDLKGRITVAFTYSSPADGKDHTADLAFDYPAPETITTLSEGDSFTVRAHKTEPTKVVPD